MSNIPCGSCSFGAKKKSVSQSARRMSKKKKNATRKKSKKTATRKKSKVLSKKSSTVFKSGFGSNLLSMMGNYDGSASDLSSSYVGQSLELQQNHYNQLDPSNISNFYRNI